MSLLSNSGNLNALLQQLVTTPYRPRNGAPLAASVADQIALRRAYCKIASQLGFGKQELAQIRKNALCISLRSSSINRQRQSSLLSSYASAASSLLYLQTRDFNSRAARRTNSKGFGLQGDNEVEETGTKGLFSFLQQKNSNHEKYEAEISKLDDAAKKAYNQGFIRALLMSDRMGDLPKAMSFTKRLLWAFTRAVLVTFLLWGILVLLKLYGKGTIDVITTGEFFVNEEEVNVTFDDVRGVDEAKMEVQEIVDYLRDPGRYTKLGARLPKGVLLVGPPGTGKTLLARAIAGEANVPFYHVSGSEFDETFVGQGAKRVRELFKKAKKNAPCVIFIDEIDSVGAKRTSSSLHPYANQTINQLLSEMDGFVQNEGVIVIGATNKKENLDSALLRPGRFDVQVNVPRPDLTGRRDIFKLYLGKIIHGDIDAMLLARGSTGFTGADIENMVNQAALKAATEMAPIVTMRHLDEAKDRILMGPARLKGRHPDEEANRNTAYHEAGHALVAMFTKHAHPIHKVTIIPRGGTLGHTSRLPEKDRLQTTKAQMLAELDVAMGGRVAEEMIFGKENVTTGAYADLKHATKIAEDMVKEYGLTDRIGLRNFSASQEDNVGLFPVNDRGPKTNEAIDEEIKSLLNESYERAKDLLTKYKKEHQLMAEALLEYETLNRADVEKVVKGEKLTRLPAIKANFGGQQRPKRRLTGVAIPKYEGEGEA